MNDLLPFAKRMLTEEGEFLPFGGHLKPDGEIVWEGAQTESERPPSQELIDVLVQGHRRLAADKQIKACGTVYDILVNPPGKAKKGDAIAVALDHVSGYSVRVVFPYRFHEDGELEVDPPFATEGDGGVFDCG